LYTSYRIDNVKRHDTFIEIEVMDKKGTISKDKQLNQCKCFLSLFKIIEKDLFSGSYCELPQKK